MHGIGGMLYLVTTVTIMQMSWNWQFVFILDE